eukprot:Amastigsp_a174350_266.p2 type:complete len:395 gc:universal Amastigsp_a174350_266:2446-1262(-)
MGALLSLPRPGHAHDGVGGIDQQKRVRADRPSAGRIIRERVLFDEYSEAFSSGRPDDELAARDPPRRLLACYAGHRVRVVPDYRLASRRGQGAVLPQVAADGCESGAARPNAPAVLVGRTFAADCVSFLRGAGVAVSPHDRGLLRLLRSVRGHCCALVCRLAVGLLLVRVLDVARDMLLALELDRRLRRMGLMVRALWPLGRRRELELVRLRLRNLCVCVCLACGRCRVYCRQLRALRGRVRNLRGEDDSLWVRHPKASWKVDSFHQGPHNAARRRVGACAWEGRPYGPHGGVHRKSHELPVPKVRAQRGQAAVDDRSGGDGGCGRGVRRTDWRRALCSGRDCVLFSVKGHVPRVLLLAVRRGDAPSPQPLQHGRAGPFPVSCVRVRDEQMELV